MLVGAALLSVTMPAATGAAPACAATTGPHAALVVDTGVGTRSFCVALDATTVSGIHLIELAGAQDQLTYGFGSGGQAVCRLAGVGPQGDDCFADYPDYWGYWHGDGHGGWTWSSSGAASARVGNGALDAWVWGSGDSGATHPKPPSLGIDDVCRTAATTSPSAAPSPSGVAATASSSTVRASTPPGPTRTSGAGHPAAPRSDPSGGRRVAAVPSERPTPAAAALAAQGPPPGSAGPGPEVLLALALGAALAGGGWLRLRSSRRERSDA